MLLEIISLEVALCVAFLQSLGLNYELFLKVDFFGVLLALFKEGLEKWRLLVILTVFFQVLRVQREADLWEFIVID